MKNAILFLLTLVSCTMNRNPHLIINQNFDYKLLDVHYWEYSYNTKLNQITLKNGKVLNVQVFPFLKDRIEEYKKQYGLILINKYVGGADSSLSEIWFVEKTNKDFVNHEIKVLDKMTLNINLNDDQTYFSLGAGGCIYNPDKTNSNIQYDETMGLPIFFVTIKPKKNPIVNRILDVNMKTLKLWDVNTKKGNCDHYWDG